MKQTPPFQKQRAAWTLNDDGSFAYTSRDIGLVDCYPAFNGHPIFSKSVKVKRRAEGGEITYHVNGGTIKLGFTSDGDALILKSVLDVPVAPHWFYPIAFARVQGANRYFKQGIGFSGPSGIFDFPVTPVKRESHQPDEAWSYDSYLASGFLTASGQAVAIGAYKHDRFLQRSTYRNRPYRYNLVDRHLESNDILFEAGFATEELTLKAPLDLPDLHFLAGSDPFPTYRRFAENIARENKVAFDNRPRYQVCTFWEFLNNYTQGHLDDLVAGLGTVKPEIPIDTIQIDGGFCVYGDWLIANRNYPHGLEHMTNTVLRAGYKAGIWIAPFCVASISQTSQEHPEWLLRNADGGIHIERELDGYLHNILDTTHPGAFEYLRQVFRTYRKWGISYYKTDFMEWGLRDRTRFKRYDNRTTSIQHVTDVNKMIREEIGPESFWLACIATYPPFVGYADAARISNDVPAGWREGSHGNLIQEAFTMHYLHQVLWQNDPDCIFLRDVDSGLQSKLTRDEAYTLAYWDAMLGGFITTSDRFHKVPLDYLRLWRFLQPGKKQMSCRFPYWSEKKNLKVAVRDYANGASAVLVVNPSAATVREEYPVQELIGAETAWLFDWKKGESSPLGRKSNVAVELRAHQSALIYVSRQNKAPARGYNLFGEMVEGI